MPEKKLVVLGSVNADHILQVGNFPRPGETVVGHGYQVIPGGKGANQAVAAARLGADVSFLACVGDDDFGARMIERFRDDGIDTSGVMSMADTPTGIAFIQIVSSGENCIAISPEANGNFTPDILEQNMGLIRSADMVLMQLEIPLETIEIAAREAQKSGAVVVLNPAPAQPLPDSLLSNLSMITPNETEAELLTGIKVENESDAHKAAKILHDKGVETVILTLGEKGAYLSSSEGSRLVEGYDVRAVDSTAAGDTFNGALVAALQQGKDVYAAIEFAHAAAAISVTRIGAQTSIPGIEEVNDFSKANH